MTEKRFIVKDRWIKDNHIGKLMNVDFNTITDANLCCELLNRSEDKRYENGKLASKYLEENEKLKSKLFDCNLELEHSKESVDDAYWKLTEIKKENEQLKSELGEKDIQLDFLKSENIHMSDLVNENKQLKKALDDFKTYDDEDFREAEYINSIYKEEGFNGVIDYAKRKLCRYGFVKEIEDGLWVMVTGGWSDNEFWLDCLNSPVSIFYMKHYCAYETGGAFYYTENPRDKIEIRLKGDVE